VGALAAFSLSAALLAGVVGGLPAASADTVIDGCDIVANPTSTSFTDCENMNLTNANFSGLALTHAHFEGSDLTGANLTGANLGAAVLTGASLVGADLDGASAVSVALGDADLANATISNVDMADAVFSDATLTDADLEGDTLVAADFSGANLTGANLQSTLFGDIVYLGTLAPPSIFANAILTDADFTGSNLMPAPGALDATSPAGASVTWPAPPTQTDESLGTCSDTGGTVQSGSTFPPGTTLVTCVIEDTTLTVGSGTFNVTVDQASQAITFTSTPPKDAVVSGPSYTAAASGGASGNPVTFTSATPDNCAVTDTTVSFTGDGDLHHRRQPNRQHQLQRCAPDPAERPSRPRPTNHHHSLHLHTTRRRTPPGRDP
jgi:uncharacterized protein YjbI with pentapeptide repeats